MQKKKKTKLRNTDLLCQTLIPTLRLNLPEYEPEHE